MAFTTPGIGWVVLNTNVTPQPPPPPVYNYNVTINNAPAATPVTPVYDPKIDANALYGRAMATCALGIAVIGASPAPIIGPYLNAGKADFVVSFGVAVPVTGNRKIYEIWLDQELAWSSVSGGTVPADGTFTAEAFDFVFKPGTLTQTVCSLETEKFPGEENAYRPQMILEIRNLTFQRFLDRTGRPIPYVACKIGDVSGGADPTDGLNLGTALERIAHSPWAGYTSSTFEAVGITDVVPAILIKDNFTIIDLCKTVTRIYRNLDLLQSDKLRIKDRANVTPDFTFDKDTMSGGDRPIQISRTGATAQRRELELLTVDPDQDYTVVPSLSKIPREPFTISAAVGKESITSPLVMSADIRQALVTYAQQYEENARRKIAFKTLATGYEIEPGDLAGLADLADGIENEVWKVTSTSHNADWTVDIEAEAILRCTIFSSPTSPTDPVAGDVVLLLHFDGSDGQTTTTDDSTYHHTMTFLGVSAISSTHSKFDGAMYCNGSAPTGSGVTTPVAAAAEFDFCTTNTSPYTIEVWAYFTSINRDQVLISRHTGIGGLHFMLRQAGDDELQYLTSSNSSSYGTTLSTTTANITAGTAHTICVDHDSTGTVRIFVDGVMMAKDTPADSIIYNGGNTPITVGCDGLNGRVFDGYIDEVRITRTSRYGDVTGDASYTPATAPFPNP